MTKVAEKEPLFTAWRHVAATIEKAPRLLVLSDFDGTLSPIVDDPTTAALPPSTKLLLENLARRDNVTFGVISGRQLPDVVARVAMPNIICAGNHGLEIHGPSIRFTHPEAERLRAILDEIHALIVPLLAKIPGVIVEQKGLSLTVHHRMASGADIPEIRKGIREAVSVSKHHDQVRIVEGNKSNEIRSTVDWDKGDAILLVRSQLCGNDARRILTVYLGDDHTDEDGFKVVRRLRGITVHIGAKENTTTAKYYLANQLQVQDFLSRLNDLLR